jgi:hypothetical protein
VRTHAEAPTDAFLAASADATTDATSGLVFSAAGMTAYIFVIASSRFANTRAARALPVSSTCAVSSSVRYFFALLSLHPTPRKQRKTHNVRRCERPGCASEAQKKKRTSGRASAA